MPVSILRLVVPLVVCTLAGGANAQDKRMLGLLTLDTGDRRADLQVFNGPVNGFVRSLAGFETNPDGAGGLLMIEGHPPQAPSGANPMQGAAGIRMDFNAPPPLGAASPAENVVLFYIADWPADRQEPAALFQSAGDVAVTFEQLRLSDGAAHAAGTAQGTVCPHDLQTDETQAGAADCFDVTLAFDTALEPFAPPVPVEERQEPAARAPAPPDDGPVTMTVLGSVKGTLDGQAREWVTISGDIHHEASSSASWQRTSISIPGFADTFGSMLGAISDEDQAQLETLDQMFSGENSLADLIGQMTGEAVGGQDFINLTISGHDPDSPNILTERVLSLDVTLDSMDAPLGVPVSADISYYVDASGGFIPKLFYISGEGGAQASVTFTQLDLGPDGGHAKGSFKGTLCRMEGARLMDGPDLSDCMQADGQFDTSLLEAASIDF